MRRIGETVIAYYSSKGDGMEDNHVTDFKTPRGVLAKMQATHFGKILFNLQFVAVAIMLASVLSFLIVALYYFFLLAVTLLTLGGIYAIYPEFASWWSGGETLNNIAVTLSSGWTYIVPIAIAVSAISVVMLSLDRTNKQTARIVISSVICALSVIILLVKLCTGA